MGCEDCKKLAAVVRTLSSRVDSLETSTGLYASDDEIERNNKDTVKFDPKRWTGPSHKGKRWRDCSPEFLDVYAEAIQYSADHPKPDRTKYVDFDKRDARHLRSWARRLRSGWQPPKSDAPEFPGDAMAPADSFSGAPSFDMPSFEEPALDDPFGADEPELF